MVSSSSEGSASKISIVRRRSVTRMSACGSRASRQGQASMLQEQQREKAWKSTGHCSSDTSLFWKSKGCGLSPQGYSPWTSLQYRFEFCTHDVFVPVSRGLAIWATGAARALINVAQIAGPRL